MKKSIMLTSAMLLFAITVSTAAYDRDQFVEEFSEEIYEGIQSGELTKREVKSLNKALRMYEFKLWQLNDYGRISRSEGKSIERMESDLIRNLENYMYNRDRARRSTYSNSDRRGVYNNPRYDNRNGRNRTSRTNGTYCPPPRRRGW